MSQTVNKNPVAPHHPVVLAMTSSQDMKLCLEETLQGMPLTLRAKPYPELNTHEALKQFLLPLFSNEFGVLLTCGSTWDHYNVFSILPQRFATRWIHLKYLPDGEDLYKRLENCFLYCSMNRLKHRPAIAVFTTSFHSFQKIFRVYNSLQRQTTPDWEWVILDDSKDDENFNWMRANLSVLDPRIRLYRRDFHSGNIGLVKNEAVMMCRAPYVVEVDHDDELLPDCLEEITAGFDKYPDVGFIYMDFAECFEDRKQFEYCKGWGWGYGDYREQVFDGVKYSVAHTPELNDVTMHAITSAPNHPRAWRKSTLMEMGNYSEFLPISDDYELCLLSVLKTKVLKIAKFAYIQFRNNGGNNFHIIRNREITKLQRAISKLYYSEFKALEFFEKQGVYEFKQRRNAYVNYRTESAIADAPRLALTAQ